MNSKFIVQQKEIIFYNNCSQGLVLQEIQGLRKYHVCNNLAKHIKPGQILTENIHFQALHRTIEDALITNKGDIINHFKSHSGTCFTIQQKNGTEKFYYQNEITILDHADILNNIHIKKNEINNT